MKISVSVLTVLGAFLVAPLHGQQTTPPPRQNPPGQAQPSQPQQNPPNQPKPGQPIPANAPHAADIRDARTAAENWIHLLDAKQFDQAYNQMGQTARSQISPGDWKSQLKEARSNAGKLVSRQYQNSDYTTKLAGAPDGQYVILQYLCSFSDQQSAIETIVMSKRNATWKVVGFSVQ